MKRIIAIVIGVLATSTLANAGELTTLVKQLKAVGPDGAGAASAAAAWAELKREKVTAIVPLLAAMDDSTPLAANWLRSAIDAIVEREVKGGTKLPASELEAFVRDIKHGPSGRRLAFELLCAADKEARARLLPTFFGDPSPELRYDAIESAFDKLRKLEKPNPESYDPSEPEKKKTKLDKDEKTIAELQKLLRASRHFEQTALIARELEAYGEKIDMTDHFGFIGRWWVLSPFDNTGGKGFATPFDPENKLDRNVTPMGKGDESTEWKFIDSKEQFATVDLNKHVGKLKNVVAYAVSDIECDTDRAVELRAASITAIKMFLNGKEVFARETYHQGMAADTHIAPVKLKAGKNTILLKICQNDQKEPWAQDWKFQLRITEADGAKVAVRNVTPVETKQ